LQIAAARGREQAIARARHRRGQAGKIGDDFGNGGGRGDMAFALFGAGGALRRWFGGRRRGRVWRRHRLAAKADRGKRADARDERQHDEAKANAQ